MALSMTGSIAAGDICNVKCYKDLKVYLLQGTDGSEIVIKCEGLGADSIKAATHAVKAVEHSARMKILSATEVNELKQYCKYVDELDAYFSELGVSKGMRGFIDRQKDAVDMLKKTLSWNDPIVKMKKQTAHHIEDAATNRGEGNKDLIRLFVSTLKAQGGLEHLGEIVAADMFNNNNDRFSPYMIAGEKKVGPYTLKMKAIMNFGNIFIVDNGNGFSASIMDYIAPTGIGMGPNRSLTNQTDDLKWMGEVLVEKSTRKKFAQNIIHDLEEVLHPNKSFFSMKKKLGRDAEERLHHGMVNGVRIIRSYFNNRANQKANMTSINERLQRLKLV